MILSRGGLGDPGAGQSGAVADLNFESVGVIAGTQPEPRERGFRKTFLLPLQKGFFRVTLTQVLVPLGEIALFETSHGRFVAVRRVTSRRCWVSERFRTAIWVHSPNREVAEQSSGCATAKGNDEALPSRSIKCAPRFRKNTASNKLPECAHCYCARHLFLAMSARRVERFNCQP